jgi:organic hydroperoxide reductase OsmC/OhrA
VTREHRYEVAVEWTGDRGTGTSSFRGYDRAHEVTAGDKPPIAGSSDPSFRGDPSRWNPEELLVVALSQCHMLWFLHLCSVNGVVVTGYRDEASGTMAQTDDGGGAFAGVTLRPRVSVAEAAMRERAEELHHEAHRLCFIANSVNFDVVAEPETIVSQGQR